MKDFDFFQLIRNPSNATNEKIYKLCEENSMVLYETFSDLMDNGADIYMLRCFHLDKPPTINEENNPELIVIGPGQQIQKTSDWFQHVIGLVNQVYPDFILMNGYTPLHRSFRLSPPLPGFLPCSGQCLIFCEPRNCYEHTKPIFNYFEKLSDASNSCRKIIQQSYYDNYAILENEHSSLCENEVPVVILRCYETSTGKGHYEHN